MGKTIYYPAMSVRSCITCAANRIRSELVIVNSYKVSDLKNNSEIADSFKSHVYEIVKNCQQLLDVCEAL